MCAIIMYFIDTTKLSPSDIFEDLEKRSTRLELIGQKK